MCTLTSQTGTQANSLRSEMDTTRLHRRRRELDPLPQRAQRTPTTPPLLPRIRRVRQCEISAFPGSNRRSGQTVTDVAIYRPLRTHLYGFSCRTWCRPLVQPGIVECAAFRRASTRPRQPHRGRISDVVRLSGDRHRCDARGRTDGGSTGPFRPRLAGPPAAYERAAQAVAVTPGFTGSSEQARRRVVVQAVEGERDEHGVADQTGYCLRWPAGEEEWATEVSQVGLLVQLGLG